MSRRRLPRLTDRLATPRLLRAFQLVGAGLILVGVAAINGQAQAQASFPLDKYPGFGRSAEAALRDDTIANWEAFRREQFIASCMKESGFEYSPAVAYPTEAMLAVADSLGVVASTASSLVSPLDRNRAYEAALPQEERERFNQTLYGESAADIDESERTGRVPAGRGADFRHGGCFGRAEGNGPTVWDTRRELDDELVAMQRGLLGSRELEATRAAHRECAQRVGGIAADSPADLDAIAAQGGADAAVSAVREECDRLWAVGYEQAQVAAAERFAQQHRALLAAAEDRYRNVMDTIRADQEFLAYLSEQVALGGSGVDGQDGLH